MGCVKNISINNFPKQYVENIGKEVDVCFHFDASNKIKGRFIRDDKEEPYLTIFQLYDGRVVLATECQYSTI